MNVCISPSMLFSRESWSHSGPITLSKFRTEESLVKKAGWECFLTIRLGDVDLVLLNMAGVTKREEDGARWTYSAGFGVVELDAFQTGVLGNTGIVA